MTSLKILVIGNDANLLVETSQVYARAKTYASNVEKYDVITPAENNSVLEINSNSFVYGLKNTNRFLTFLSLWKKLNELSKKNQYDLVSAQDPFEFGFLAFVFSKKNKCKLHLQEHGDFYGEGNRFWLQESWLNRLRNVLGKKLLHRADGVRVVSNRIKESLIKIGVNKNKIVVAPIIEKNLNETQPQIKNDEFNIIFVGRLVKAKNIPMILRAMQTCCSTKDFTGNFYFVGEGELKSYIEKFINKNNLNDRVKLIGWTDRLESYYANAKIIVLTSWHEGWGRVIVDAGVYGVVPIMTKVGCANELVVDGKSGLIVNYDDDYQLAQKLIKLFRERNELMKLSTNIKNDVENFLGSYDLNQKVLESWQQTVNTNLI